MYLIKYGRKKEVIMKVLGGLVFGFWVLILLVVSSPFASPPPFHSSMSSVTEVYQMLISTFPSKPVWSIQSFSLVPPL